MGMDDDNDCPEHVWRLTAAVLARSDDLDSYIILECRRCVTVCTVTPEQEMDRTAERHQLEGLVEGAP